MMICVVIKGPTFADAHQQISKAVEYADLVELRLDGFTVLDLAALRILREHFSIPMIFTLRSAAQGGSYTNSEEDRLADIRRLMALRPEYIDLEHPIPKLFLHEASSRYSDIKWILSSHDFTETPEDLDGLYREMRRIPASFYKIAVMANNCVDALRFVCWAKKSDGPLIAISMGPHGQVSRILGPIIGCPMAYASLDEEHVSAPGQLSAKTLIERYHYRTSNPHTSLYALIGDPVDRSISDVTHNRLMTALGLEAVYVKIQVSPHELPEFLRFAKQLRFRGLSVTMPLKEHILPFLDDIDPQAQAIGAVNTLRFDGDTIFGCNTDGFGALNAIERECSVKDKRIVIIGAGGAAKAIAFEATRRGGLVTIVNRDAKRARQIAHCVGKGLDEMSACAGAGYDILINCTPVPMPISVDDILPHAIVMDIMTKPKETLFLVKAREKGCRIVYGYQMFVEQALGQFQLWFPNLDTQESREILEKAAVDI